MQMRDPLDLLPLRQHVKAGGEAARGFARQALLDQLSKPGRYRIVGDGQGAQVLAASESALAEARTLLQQAYGSSIVFGTPTVHTYVDAEAGTTMVPVIFVRIDAPRGHGRELHSLLQARGAHVRETGVQRDRIVIRAEAVLARALDLEHAIAELTDGAAQVLSWLVRYEPANQPHPHDKGVPA
jgi:hypothetical protein